MSTLTLGTMGFAGAGGFDDIGDIDVDGARRQLDLCIDAGVNLVDTANMYSDGASEEVLGEALDGGRRDKLMVATKVRFAMGDGANDAGLSRRHIIESVEASLRRLGADHIDLLQVHEWDGQTPLEETLSALDDLVRAGKVRYVGCSNYTGWQLVKAMGVAERRGFEPFVSQQIHYTPQAREAEFELLPAGLDQGLGTLVWSPIAGGLLSGKYRRGQDGPEGSRHVGDWDEPPVHDPDALYDLIDVLVEVGDAPRRLGRPGHAGLAADPPGRDLADRGRAHRGAAGRQPGGRLAGADAPTRSSASTRPAARTCRTRCGTRRRTRRTG